MTRTIGYYVHHHGDGHRQRAIAIASQAADRFVLLGTGLAGRTDGLASIDLPDDRPVGTAAFDGADGEEARPHALLYAPTDHQGVRERVARITGWIETALPGLMVADVSTEIAMLGSDYDGLIQSHLAGRRRLHDPDGTARIALRLLALADTGVRAASTEQSLHGVMS